MTHAPLLVGLRVAGRRCLVLGDGPEAPERVRRLCDAGADVVWHAPGATAHEARGSLCRAPDEPSLLELSAAFLVVETRRDPARAAALYARATGREGGEGCGFLVLCVDQPEFCTVTSLAVARCGDLQIGISTAGKAPGFAAKLRAALEARLGPDLAAYVDRLGRLRSATAAGLRRVALSRALEGFELELSYRIPEDRG